MKKHWKKILLVFAALVLAAGGYLLYIFKFKEYDIADAEIEEITRETYKIELPDGTFIELDEEGNIVESDNSGSSSDGTAYAAEQDSSGGSGNGSDNGNTGNHSGSSNGNTGSNDGNSGSNESNSGQSGNTKGAANGGSSSTNNGSGGSNSGSGSSNGNSGGSSGGGTNGNTGGSGSGSSGSGEVTVAAIKEKYMPVMNDLSSQANARIDALVGRAINEYSTKRANGESIDYAYFYNKYTSAAAELEGRTDKVFYSVIGVVEKELEKNGFSKTHAQSFVKEYQASKEARKKALMDRAMGRS